MTLSAPTSTENECLFCLEHTYNEFSSDDDDIEKNLTPATHGRKSMKDGQPVHKFDTLFACSCVVYAHPHCLQQWLLHQQTCPICIQPLSPDTTLLRYPSTEFEFELEIEHEPERQPCDDCTYGQVVSRIAYVVISCTVIYLLFVWENYS